MTTATSKCLLFFVLFVHATYHKPARTQSNKKKVGYWKRESNKCLEWTRILTVFHKATPFHTMFVTGELMLFKHNFFSVLLIGLFILDFFFHSHPFFFIFVRSAFHYNVCEKLWKTVYNFQAASKTTRALLQNQIIKSVSALLRKIRAHQTSAMLCSMKEGSTNMEKKCIKRN